MNPKPRFPWLGVRGLRWIIGALSVLLVTALVLILCRDLIFRGLVARGIQEGTGLRVELGQFHTSLGSSAIQLRQLKIFNPPQFGGALMASIPEFVIDLDPRQAADGKLHFRNLRLHLAELNIINSPEGRLNLEGIEKAVRTRMPRGRKRKEDKAGFEFEGVDQLTLTVGQVHYTDLRHPNRSRTMDLAIRDEVVTGLNSEEDLQRWAGALVSRILMQEALKSLRRGDADAPQPDAVPGADRNTSPQVP